MRELGRARRVDAPFVPLDLEDHPQDEPDDAAQDKRSEELMWGGGRAAVGGRQGVIDAAVAA